MATNAAHAVKATPASMMQKLTLLREQEVNRMYNDYAESLYSRENRKQEENYEDIYNYIDKLKKSYQRNGEAFLQ